MMRFAWSAAVLALAGCDAVFGLEPPAAASGWSELVAGSAHVCGRTGNGELFCWGGNANGEVGIGDDLPIIDAPGAVDGAWSTVTSSFAHSCGLRSDGSAWCWGNNQTAQLGNGSTTSSTVPRQVPGTWTSIVAGYITTCAIASDQQLWCWGSGAAGQLGNGSTDAQLSPARVGDAAWLAVSPGLQHTCGLHADRTLWCWGSVGASSPLLAEPTPVPVQLGADTWSQLAASTSTACGITTGGQLRCWGRNAFRELGIGYPPERVDEPAPVLVDGEDHADWTQLDGGLNGFCATRAGEAYCWGYNERAQLGAPERLIERPRPITHPDTRAWRHVSIGTATTCLVDEDDRAWCLGLDATGQFATGGTSPREPTTLATPYTLIATGTQVTCGIVGTTLACSGYNNEWQLGTGDFFPRQEMTSIDGAWNSVVIGNKHTCAIADTGLLWCWGTDENGALGNGPAMEFQPRPVRATSDLMFSSLAAGAAHSCGISGVGLFCWGANHQGQIGNGTNMNASVPTGVMGSWKRASAGEAHTCAITSLDRLSCWGANARGQLGVGNTMNSALPVPVGTATWTAVSAGFDHTCGIRSDGTLWCWGDNANSQLGASSGFATYSHVPLQVAEPVQTWTAVSVGVQYSCAIASDATLWCWGANQRGQLGDGSLVARPRPVKVAGTGWTQISVARDHACGVRDGATVCWGSNDNGAVATGLAWTPELREIVRPD